MHRLTLGDYYKVQHLFTEPHLTFVIDAMSAGNSPAHMWVDDLEMPRAAFVWDGTHSLYIAGEADFTPILANITLPPPITKIYAAHDQPTIERLFPQFTFQTRERVLFQLQQQGTVNWRERVSAGFVVRLIDEDLLLRQNLPNADHVLEEIESCWTALDRFFAHGFGYCVVGEAIAAWCTAEYVSGKVCGIGIETVEAYQRRGFATLVASAFIEHCRKQHITAHWDAWASNTPSVAVARKIGLKQITSYNIYIGVGKN